MDYPFPPPPRALHPAPCSFKFQFKLGFDPCLHCKCKCIRYENHTSVDNDHHESTLSYSEIHRCLKYRISFLGNNRLGCDKHQRHNFAKHKAPFLVFSQFQCIYSSCPQCNGNQSPYHTSKKNARKANHQKDTE